MKTARSYMLDTEVRENWRGFESVSYQNWIGRLKCTPATYKKTIASEGYKLDESFWESNTRYFCRFYLYDEEENDTSKGGDHLFGFVEVFVKKFGKCGEIPDHIHPVHDSIDWIEVTNFLITLHGLHTQRSDNSDA
jgi:hypothetical protein